MEAYDIYTIGSAYYLEKIFNAIRLIVDSEGSFTWLMKSSALIALVILVTRAGLNNDYKSFIKWFFGVTILVGFFLTSKATVHIHDTLPDSYGIVPAPRTVEKVPLGLALLGSMTSRVGFAISEKFNTAFAGTFVNSEYQRTGLLFGSKIVEDAGKMRISDTALKHFMIKFYKQCIVPDVNMGYNRVNGYTVKDLVESEDILDFLKNHASKARMIYFNGKIREAKEGEKPNFKDFNGYVSCNNAALYISNMLDYELDQRMPKIASSFMSYFFPDQQDVDKSTLFKTVLENSYGIFIKKSSNEAKDILLQNVMINTISDTVRTFDKAYGSVATDEMSKSAFYSVSQMAQKFVPILRAVLECVFYGVFPLILILMVTPIGFEVLKNYGFSFIYLQLWQPLYAILFCIAASWGKAYASDTQVLTFATHAKISKINDEISMVAGYMLLSIPVISTYITKGMVSSMGNLASSIFYIPQTAAVNNAEQVVKGNYQLGNSSIGNHSYNTTSANKYDDNYSWLSGMKSFSMQSGAQERMFADGRVGIDSSSSINNLAGLARVDWNKAMGSRLDQNESSAMNSISRSSSSMVESSAAGYSKLLGYNDNFSQNSTAYQSWQKNLSSDQRTALDNVKGFVSKLSESHGLSTQDALRVAVAANAGVNIGFGKGGMLGAGLGVSGSIEGSRGAAVTEAYNEAKEASRSQNLSESLSKLQTSVMNNTYQTQDGRAQEMMDRVQSDFAQSQSANFERTKALENLNSIQTVKGYYEQNSNSINQDLSHKFSEWGISKFGATQFEKIVRDNPEQTNKLLNQFIDEKGFGDIAKPNIDVAHFQSKNEGIVADHYRGNKEQVQNTHQVNQAKTEAQMPKNFKEETKQNLQTAEQVKDNVIENMQSTSNKMNDNEGQVNTAMSQTERKVKEENQKTATRKVYEKTTQ
ncbi:hypothetical protein NF27_IP00050 [Candidatus Jidaibacter acanthamoeba]|uniref:TraG N-terminal Proteobacteria domain-containing protein n=1 Tax=Candidatus Jidaibacter acanthamoebae TaxID=86105 RepID=A0A0C1MQH6_9RICK|nr:conjugal transfer protein TraG N-terminal domain-containing protein [Candidatus Jidaibacter acanthamoeba]KIE04237.1 hypothetical protein NF27_IP00050 [Candidatus Jidaibacter acanthamoeba]